MRQKARSHEEQSICKTRSPYVPGRWLVSNLNEVCKRENEDETAAGRNECSRSRRGEKGEEQRASKNLCRVGGCTPKTPSRVRAVSSGGSLQLHLRSNAPLAPPPVRPKRSKFVFPYQLRGQISESASKSRRSILPLDMTNWPLQLTLTTDPVAFQPASLGIRAATPYRHLRPSRCLRAFALLSNTSSIECLPKSRRSIRLQIRRSQALAEERMVLHPHAFGTGRQAAGIEMRLAFFPSSCGLVSKKAGRRRGGAGCL